MAKKTEYQYRGSTHYFTPKPPKKAGDNDWVWGVAFAVIVVLLLSTCS